MLVKGALIWPLPPIVPLLVNVAAENPPPCMVRLAPAAMLALLVTFTAMPEGSTTSTSRDRSTRCR